MAIGDGSFLKIISKWSSKVITSTTGTLDVRVSLDQNLDGQIWRLERLENGSFALKCMQKNQDGQYMYLSYDGADKRPMPQDLDHPKLVLSSYTAEGWVVQFWEGTEYRLFPQYHEYYNAQVDPSDNSNSAALTLEAFNEAAYQKWILQEVPPWD